MAKVKYKTEDQVRDTAKTILGFDKIESKIQRLIVRKLAWRK